MGSEMCIRDRQIAVSDIADGLLRYLPELNANGQPYDSVGFHVVDAGVDSGENIDPQERYLTLNIQNVNDAPGGSDNTITITEDTPFTFSSASFGFSDPHDGDAFLELAIQTLPETGSLTLNGSAVEIDDIITTADLDLSALVYQPSLNTTGSGYNGIGFLVTDDGGVANGGENTDPQPNFISFDLASVNDAPLLVANGATLDEGDSITLTREMLTGTDADDQLPHELTFSLLSLPVAGELRLDNTALEIGDSFTLEAIDDGVLSYHNDGSELSSDSVQLSLADGGEDGAAPAFGSLTLTIIEVIDPPIELTPDEIQLSYGENFDSESGDLLISGFTGLNQDQFVNNTDLVLEVIEQPAHGTVFLNSDGTFTYHHNGSNIYTDGFTYQVTNADGIATQATVSIVIQPPLGNALGSGIEPPTPVSLPVITAPIEAAESISESNSEANSEDENETSGEAETEEEQAGDSEDQQDSNETGDPSQSLLNGVDNRFALAAVQRIHGQQGQFLICLLYTSPSPRDS